MKKQPKMPSIPFYGYVLLLGGIIASAAIFVGAIILLVASFAENPAVEVSTTQDYIQFALAISVSSLALGATLSAFYRVRNGGEGENAFLTWAARLSPILVLIGAVGGVFGARSIEQTQRDLAADSARYRCDKTLADEVSQAVFDRCLTEVKYCEQRAKLEPCHDLQDAADAAECTTFVRKAEAELSEDSRALVDSWLADADWDDRAVATCILSRVSAK